MSFSMMREAKLYVGGYMREDMWVDSSHSLLNHVCSHFSLILGPKE